MKEFNEEQLLDLLCKKAVSGLDSNELAELARLENEYPEWADDEGFEIAAASINLSAIDLNEEMPAHLKTKILESSIQYFEPEIQQVTDQSEDFQKTFEFQPRTSFWKSLGWGIAAFACVSLAVNLYLTRFQSGINVVEKTPPATQTPTPKPSNVEQRSQFLASANDTITVEVAKADPKSPVEITGDVVWSAKEQKGFMRFRGLPANDPEKSTYQLWIFDAAQDEKYPVDGGVFDIDENGEVVIPIDAKINIKKPTLFAVTKEKPGGVVVSDRKGIVAVAKV